MIHSVSLPIAVAWHSCLFENIIVQHFTVLKIFLAGLGPPLSALLCACFPQCFPDLGHICCDLMHATLVSCIDCHMKYMVLKRFEAGPGSSVSTIIVSKVAVSAVSSCMPSCLPVLFHVTCPLHSNRGGEGTVTWGAFPRGCDGTVAQRCFLYKGGGVHCSQGTSWMMMQSQAF